MAPEQHARRIPLESEKARIQRAVKLSPIFEKASRVTRDAVCASGELDLVLGDGCVFRQGAPSDGLLILGRGRVRVERTTPDARLIPLGYRGAGDLLGESCVVGPTPHTDEATAMEESELVRIPIALVQEILLSDPSLATALLGLILSRQREAEDRIESLLFRNVEGRVVEFLLKAADRWGVPNPKGTLISAPVTHLEIAQSIGSTRETVTLTLGALRREGLLDVAGRRLIVKDRDALALKHVL